MIIREANEADIDAIVRLLADDGLGRGREAPGDPAHALAFARMSAQPNNFYLVADEAGDLLGCLQFTLIHGLSRKGASRAQLEGVRVRAERRSQDIGGALFAATFARARDSALRVYERLGFVASHWGIKREL